MLPNNSPKKKPNARNKNKMAKNHVANSRGNPFQQDVVGILRALGHVTYDFKYRKCME